MASLISIKDILTKNKQRLTAKYGLSLMAIFGSYGRDQQHENSDVDILVDFERPVGIEFIDLACELEDLLKLKVDLVSKKGVKPRYLRQIEQDLRYV
jgi:predicted nucleotidyltransferase